MAWIYTLFTVGCGSGSHWCRHQWPGRHAGCDGERLRIGSVLFSRTTSTRARPLVLHPHVQVSQVLFLQELCVHALPLLVRVLLRILRSGVCVTQYYSNQACLYVHGCTWEENTSHFSVHQKSEIEVRLCSRYRLKLTANFFARCIRNDVDYWLLIFQALQFEVGKTDILCFTIIISFI